jgi:hypothetical protein
MDNNTKFSQSDSVQSSDMGLEDPKASELSSEFVGRWTKLISTTNWEKGRIIQEWRDALMGSEASPATFSDEAWSRRVGGVSAQHVGRLRRVHERFGDSYASYQGLYWTHFLAAMDWEDAEMWLEGAAQSSWSISEMRRTRWEALGSDPKTQPKDADLRASSDDEDFVPLNEVDPITGEDRDPYGVEQTGPRYDEPDFGDEGETASSKSSDDQDDLAPWEDSDTAQAVQEESPFAKLPSLPVDLAEALEQFKLAIIRHRAMAWAEVSQSDVVRTLDALKTFALQ